MIIQIYEIQSPAEAEQCVELGVDHVGSVILEANEWRQPHLRETIKVIKGTPAKSCIIPLFNGLDDLSRLIDYYQPHFIHFCDSLHFKGFRRVLIQQIPCMVIAPYAVDAAVCMFAEKNICSSVSQ